MEGTPHLTSTGTIALIKEHKYDQFAVLFYVQQISVLAEFQCLFLNK